MYKRKIERPDGDFVLSIIKESYKIMQKKPLFSILQNIFKEFYLPSPQYVLSLVLILGLAVGVFMPEAEASLISDVNYFDEYYLQGDYYYE